MISYLLVGSLVAPAILGLSLLWLAPHRSATLVPGLSWVVVGILAFLLAGRLHGAPFHLGLVSMGFGGFALIWALAVYLVGAIVMSFARRYLAAGAMAIFAACAPGVLMGIALVVTASDIATLLIGWLLASACYLMLFATRSTRTSKRSIVRAFVAGDLLIVSGLVIAWFCVGNITIATLDQQRAHASWVLPVALLLALGVLVRSAQAPFVTWLRVTIDAPTPVSALLHAGVINGGMILLLRLAPIVLADRPVVWLLALAGGVTAVFGLTSARQRPDYKGRLVLSTSAQMGFVLVEISMGLMVLALVHLILHALYKAWLFLTSSSQIGVVTSRRDRSSSRSRQGQHVGIAILAAMASALAMVVASPTVSTTVALAFGAFAFMTAATFLVRSLADSSGAWRPILWIAGSVISFGFLGLVIRLVGALTGSLGSPALPTTLSPLWLIVVGVGVIAACFGMRVDAVRVFVSSLGYPKRFESPALVRPAPLIVPLCEHDPQVDLELAG